jgi:hypothetical protein
LIADYDTTYDLDVDETILNFNVSKSILFHSKYPIFMCLSDDNAHTNILGSKCLLAWIICPKVFLNM